jgi:hypothetical protein
MLARKKQQQPGRRNATAVRDWCQDAAHPELYAPVKSGEHRLQKILTATSDLRASAAIK